MKCGFQRFPDTQKEHTEKVVRFLFRVGYELVKLKTANKCATGLFSHAIVQFDKQK